jgi:hypothetical protein
MTPEEFKEFKGLTYSEMGELFGIKRTRVYDICHGKKGCLRLGEINSIVRNSDGFIHAEDLGLEVC